MSEARLQQEGPGRFVLSGVLSKDTVPALLREHAAPFRDAPAELVLDLGGVSHADSAGMALLLHWLRQARAGSRTIRFRSLPAQLSAIAQVSGLQEVLPLNAH